MKLPAVTTPKTTPERLLDLLRQKPGISRKELVDMLEISVDGVKYHLNQLRDEGHILHVGPSRGGHWEVIEL